MAMMERRRPSAAATAPAAPAAPAAALAPLQESAPAASSASAAATVAEAKAPAAAEAEDAAAATAPAAAEEMQAAPVPAIAATEANAEAPADTATALEASAPAAAAAEASAAPAAAATAATASGAATAGAAAPRVRRPAGTTLTAKERRDGSMLAELYSIFIATEHLERAFVKSLVSVEDYERNCSQLITQFKTLQNGLRDRYPDLRDFIQEQGLSVPLATERLLGTGVLATALYGTAGTKEKESLACFKASEGFITLSDALKLNLTAVDDLYPLVRDLQASIVSIPNLPPLAGLERVASWLVVLNGLRASDHLDEAQCRQLALDVEQAYTALKGWLQERT
eukprot:TRINITY_DN71165_c0_g1_i1.p1 TRINITY_DN71165_c0_g1~~TRINITY_DN71165_c0_g1_i1.p1  ORF type:complete len:341 (+),score=95.23 TRINITY_DN71165_c0_g1_i1:91-1113(+)